MLVRKVTLGMGCRDRVYGIRGGRIGLRLENWIRSDRGRIGWDWCTLSRSIGESINIFIGTVGVRQPANRMENEIEIKF